MGPERLSSRFGDVDSPPMPPATKTPTKTPVAAPERSLVQVREVRERVAIPVVGMGGVQRGRHVHDLVGVGADLVAVGTESFRDPLAGERIAAEWREHVANSGFSAVA